MHIPSYLTDTRICVLYNTRSIKLSLKSFKLVNGQSCHCNDHDVRHDMHAAYKL